MGKMLEWKDAWLLGIEFLDVEHREMVRLLNRLVDSDPSSEAPERLVDRLDALMAHLRVHFRKEEEFLRVIKYPRFDDHKKEHVMEMAEFIQLRRDMDGSSTQFLDQVTVKAIKQWFFNHVVAEDRRFADYYFRFYPQVKAS